MEFPRKIIDSLLSLCIDYVVKNLPKYLDDVDSLKLLPPHVKDRMLQKFTSSSFFWTHINFKKALNALVHPMTKRIDLTLATVDDDVLEILCESRNFRNVYLLTRVANSNVTSKGLIHFLSSLKHLQLLQIANCSAVNDDVLKTIAQNCPSLSGLEVNGCVNVTDVALEAMSNMEHLKWLTFSSTQVTNKGIETLASGPSGLNIKELRLANCEHISSEILHTIIQYCPNIEVLVFYNLQSNENACQTYLPLHEGSLKNLKQLTWTVQW